MSQLSEITELFWSQSFWFGETNYTWKDFEDVNTSTYELLYPIPIAILFLVTRGILINFVLEKLGPLVGPKQTSLEHNSSENAKLTTAFKKYRKTSDNKETIIKKAIESGMSERQAERWLRKQIQKEKPTKSKKLLETTWRAVYYLGMCLSLIHI